MLLMKVSRAVCAHWRPAHIMPFIGLRVRNRMKAQIEAMYKRAQRFVSKRLSKFDFEMATNSLGQSRQRIQGNGCHIRVEKAV